MLDVKALLNKLVGHYNNVGSVESGGTSTSTSLSDSTSWSTIGINKSVGKGVWLIQADVRFASKAYTSYRSARMHVTDGTFDDNLVSSIGTVFGTTTHYQAGTGETSIFMTGCVSSSTSWTFDIEIRQHGSTTSAINYTYYYQMIRIK